jgi:hypothetical protein
MSEDYLVKYTSKSDFTRLATGVNLVSMIMIGDIKNDGITVNSTRLRNKTNEIINQLDELELIIEEEKARIKAIKKQLKKESKNGNE